MVLHGLFPVSLLELGVGCRGLDTQQVIQLCVHHGGLLLITFKTTSFNKSAMKVEKNERRRGGEK